MAEAVVLCRLEALPGGIAAMQAQARAEGYGFVDRLVAEWHSGANRFDAPGEVLLAARCGDALAGVGGLNRDPYDGGGETGRLRHLYVAPRWRGAGIGRQLVDALLARAAGGVGSGGVRGRFGRVRLRVSDAAAARFYEALGFDPVAEPRATHAIRIDAP